MDIQDLRTFLAIADRASFSKAADALHVTQPAVSKRIQALERDLGTSLFDRVGKRIYLTEAGRLLYPQAQSMLDSLADTQRQLRNLSNKVAGSLHLATSHHIGLHRLEPVLAQFTQQYPEVQLNIAFEDSEVAHALVAQGQVELAIVTLNPDGESGLAATPIWVDPLQFVSAQAIAETQSLAQLAAQPCVLPGIGTYTGRIVLQRFAEQGISLQPAMSTNYLETIGMLVNVGLGWSVLPKSMTAHLQILAVDCEPMTRTLGHVGNPQRAMSNAAKAFVQVLEQFIDR